MNLKKIIFLVIVMVLLSACGSDDSSSNAGSGSIPTVKAGEDKTTNINESITLTGVADDRDGVIVAYEWKEGDTVLATTVSFEFVPTTQGVHTLTLRVTDDDGNSVKDSVNIKVLSESQDIGSSNSINTPLSHASFAVLSYSDSDRYSKNYSDMISREISNLNEWSKISKEFPFNGEMMIDLGLNSEDSSLVKAHTNKNHMWLGSWSGDEGYILLEFKDKNNNIVHTFEYKKPTGYNSGYIALDGNKHNKSDARYQTDIHGYIYIKESKLEYDGEYRIYQGAKWNGLDDKTWLLSDYAKIKTVKISIGAKGTYNFSGIPLYIEY